MHKRAVLENSSQVVNLPVALAWHRMFENCVKQKRNVFFIPPLLLLRKPEDLILHVM
jgi:hypothetical protein